MKTLILDNNTPQEVWNEFNETLARGNTRSGVRSVYPLSNGKWLVKYSRGNQTFNVGTFATKQEARAALVEHKKKRGLI